MRKKILKLLIPQKYYNKFNYFNNILIKNDSKKHVEIVLNPNEQDLGLYWDPEFAEALENWGIDNTWNEIQLLLSSCKGKVLDIACGTGITMEILKKYPQLDLYGFDISDLLIEKAIQKNILIDNLKVADATKSNYLENEFDYSYSIGSLEHFTLEGIDKFLEESSRITNKVSFHMIPVSKSNTNEGWMKTVQSYFNNSEEWWMNKFKRHYMNVYSIPSKWEDSISYGRWFICQNKL